jgi:hypothetical protein
VSVNILYSQHTGPSAQTICLAIVTIQIACVDVSNAISRVVRATGVLNKAINKIKVQSELVNYNRMHS